MSATYSYPGIYLTETANLPRTVTPATTSMTAIVGSFARGPVDEAVLVTSAAAFEAEFGGGPVEGLAPYAVSQFFANGGTGAWIVRLSAPGSAAGTAALEGMTVTANSPGAWSGTLAVALETSKIPGNGAGGAAPTHLDFVVTSGVPSPGESTPELERIPNLPAADAGELATLITAASQYVVASVTGGSPPPSSPVAPASARFLAGGSDGNWGADPTAFLAAVNTQLGNPPDAPPASGTPAGGGVPAAAVTAAVLDLIAPQVFNILCVPDLVWVDAADQIPVLEAAHKYAARHQAFLLVDPPPPVAAIDRAPSWASAAVTTVDRVGTDPQAMSTLLAWGGPLLRPGNNSGAVYYPWLIIPDPARAGNQLYVPPSGTVAGVYASTDAARGVWKAPAGVDASLSGIIALADNTINDAANGGMNVLGVNALRTFPIYSSVVWGSRTLAGSDLADDAWKYVPVRRLTDFIEQTLLQSLRWAIFEPNGPGLWASIRLEVGAFMSSLFSAGAFAGASAAQAYQVVCDETTTTEADMLAGIVRVLVAFAPVEPAEFVVLNIELNAGTTAN